MPRTDWIPAHDDNRKHEGRSRNKLLNHSDERVRNIGAFIDAAPTNTSHAEVAFLSLTMGLAYASEHPGEAEELLILILDATRDRNMTTEEAVAMAKDIARSAISGEEP